MLAVHACLCLLVTQDCPGGSCLQGHLSSAMHHCGGKHHPAQPKAAAAPPSAALAGSLELPGSNERLQLELPAARLFALELAGLQGSAQQLLASIKQQAAEQQDQVRVPWDDSSLGQPWRMQTGCGSVQRCCRRIA